MRKNITETYNNSNVSPSNVNPQIALSEQKYEEAKEATEKALLDLGKKYFEANFDNESAEFFGEISAVKECGQMEKVWYQYRLSLDEKMQCESCGAIITSDSLFCNKCGSKVVPTDFTLIENYLVPEAPKTKTCPSCGKTLVGEAKFCEKCGFKL
ncbi:MAG: zinc ribbon domain-containing protein [Lachnospiraceae bacterium]|nr:zinc ribbon domain-containing protein [Lachnospiraceae bacterium]